MPAVLDALFGVIILAGLALAGTGYSCYRRWDHLGVTALAWFAIILGIGFVLSGAVGILYGTGGDGQPVWIRLGYVFWAVATVPWFLFTLQYTGHRKRVGWRIIAVLYAPFVGLGINALAAAIDPDWIGIANAISSVALIYCSALVFLGVFFLVQSTHSYVHLSFTAGVLLSIAPTLFIFSGNSVGMIQQTSVLLGVGQFALAAAISVVTFSFGVRHGSLLDKTPAVERLGNRAVSRETDDLVFVTDGEDVIVRCNTAAVQTLGEPRETIRGSALPSVVGHDSETLDSVETAPVETVSGSRQYDPQVSPITDGRDDSLGAVLSLRDVTERELREQRLAVLNRALRHNLRNKVDVLKSHAEIVDNERGGDHVSAIRDTADEITELGTTARSIDQFLSDLTETEQVDIVDLVDGLSNLDGKRNGVTVTRDLPDTAVVETNPQALRAALESATDNAITYANSTVDLTVTATETGYEITVTDDGPGIPESELRSLDSGTETPLQHGTGLGLWQLKWAVKTLGGELSFETESGTTVRFTVPDHQ